MHTHGEADPAATKRIYIAPDDHTDYMWTADEATYRQAFLAMLDYYLDLADSTAGNAAEYQSRWNCDGSFWLWEYERNRPSAEFQRLIDRIRDGHVTVPLNPLAVVCGGMPAEAVLRGMYYAGQLERRFNLRFRMALSMENQTLPYGLGALWAGAGAKYSWKGICGCASQVPDAWDRRARDLLVGRVGRQPHPDEVELDAHRQPEHGRLRRGAQSWLDGGVR